jgi:hypothetical protein
MTSTTENALKRKETAEKPEAVVSNDQNKRKARRVSTDDSPSNATFLQFNTPVVSEKAAAANTAFTEHIESIYSIGKMIKDLSHSDNAKVNAILDALFLNLGKDKKKCDKIQAVGGYLALVQLLEKCLVKTLAILPACDKVTELNELAELKTLYKTLDVIIGMTFQHDESKVGITALNGVESVVKIMKTFPSAKGYSRLRVPPCVTLQPGMPLARRTPSNWVESRLFLPLSAITWVL